MRRLFVAALFLGTVATLIAFGGRETYRGVTVLPPGLLASSVPGVGVPVSHAIQSATSDATTAAVVAAADALLAELDNSQTAEVRFQFDDDAQRANWSNLPSGIFERTGIRMGDLDAAQRDSVHAILRATLSDFGFRQVMDNVAGDQVLSQSGGRGRIAFGEDEYYFSILGTPSTEEPWMWQFGGHHLAINATIVGGNIVLTPSLTGGQPMTYTRDGETVNQLESEIDHAFTLINTLDSTQQREAIVDARYVDLVWGPTQDGRATTPVGIRADALTASQRVLLMELIGQRVNLLNEDDAAVKMAEVEANIDNTYFAWYGPTTTGSAVYYRVHGPAVWIEYAPQALGGEPTQHIHAIYRDPTNDYAVRLVAARAQGAEE